MMNSTAEADEFFNALDTLNFGRVTRVGGGWGFIYDPQPTKHTDGLRRVSVQLYISDNAISYEKIVDGQKRQYQHPDQTYTDFDLDKFILSGDEEIEYRYEIVEQGAPSFEFEIVIDGESYYDFFHEESQPDI